MRYTVNPTIAGISVASPGLVQRHRQAGRPALLDEVRQVVRGRAPGCLSGSATPRSRLSVRRISPSAELLTVLMVSSASRPAFGSSSTNRALTDEVTLIDIERVPDDVVQFTRDAQAFLGDAAACLVLALALGALGAFLGAEDVRALGPHPGAGEHRERHASRARRGSGSCTRGCAGDLGDGEADDQRHDRRRQGDAAAAVAAHRVQGDEVGGGRRVGASQEHGESARKAETDDKSGNGIAFLAEQRGGVERAENQRRRRVRGRERRVGTGRIPRPTGVRRQG